MIPQVTRVGEELYCDCPEPFQHDLGKQVVHCEKPSLDAELFDHFIQFKYKAPIPSPLLSPPPPALLSPSPPLHLPLVQVLDLPEEPYHWMNGVKSIIRSTGMSTRYTLKPCLGKPSRNAKKNTFLFQFLGNKAGKLFQLFLSA